MSAADYVAMMKKAKVRTEMLQFALRQNDLAKAYLRYNAECKKCPLGQQVKVVETDLDLQIEATEEIEMGRPITAFAGDVLALTVPIKLGEVSKWDGRKGKSEAVKLPDGSPIHWHYFVPAGGTSLKLAVSKYDLETAYLQFIFKVGSVPIASFAPAEVAITHIEAPAHTPDICGIWVQDVVAHDPYDALEQVPEAVPTFAQVTLSYLQKVSANANVRVGAASGQPTVLLATRKIEKGEILRTGRPPLHWIGDRGYTEAVYEYLKARPAPGVPSEMLSGMMFGDGAD